MAQSGSSGVAVSVARIAARMRAHPAEEYPLEALAREAGLSRFQFLRAFRGATDRTPRAFLLDLRIELAEALLAAGLPASEVALRCGFFDQPHFTRAFKRATGVTPARFARARAESISEPISEARPETQAPPHDGPRPRPAGAFHERT